MTGTSTIFRVINKPSVGRQRQIVIKWNRMGQDIPGDDFADAEFNSPFEEVAIAVRLATGGVPTTYLWAIYRAGLSSGVSESLFDCQRYDSHRGLVTPHGEPILVPHGEYIPMWGYWNGPDEKLVARDGDYLEKFNALRAWPDGSITESTYVALMQRVREKLDALSVEDLNLRGTHILLSRRLSSGKLSSGKLIYDADGCPEARICNFELLRMTSGWDWDAPPTALYQRSNPGWAHARRQAACDTAAPGAAPVRRAADRQRRNWDTSAHRASFH